MAIYGIDQFIRIIYGHRTLPNKPHECHVFCWKIHEPRKRGLHRHTVILKSPQKHRGVQLKQKWWRCNRETSQAIWLAIFGVLATATYDFNIFQCIPEQDQMYCLLVLKHGNCSIRPFINFRFPLVYLLFAAEFPLHHLWWTPKDHS